MTSECGYPSLFLPTPGARAIAYPATGTCSCLLCNKRLISFQLLSPTPQTLRRRLAFILLLSQKEMVTTNLESLRNAIDGKRKNLEAIVMVMRRKIGEIEAKRAEFKGGEEAKA